jgi:hypothetical protein
LYQHYKRGFSEQPKHTAFPYLADEHLRAPLSVPPNSNVEQCFAATYFFVPAWHMYLLQKNSKKLLLVLVVFATRFKVQTVQGTKDAT